MTVDPDRYLAPYNSEHNLGKDPSCGCYLGCGLSTDWHGEAFATLGESTVDRTGKPKGKAQLTRDLKRGWRAFKAKPDFNGIPDTDDLERIHAGMWGDDSPLPDRFWTRAWDDVMDVWKGRKHVISIAVRLSALPQDQRVDPYTRADHQVLLVPDGKNGRTRIYGPMKPHSRSYRGHFGPLGEVRKAAAAIEGGLILCWLYEIGGSTREAIETKRIRRQAARRVANRDERIKTLKAKLRACEEGGGTDCDDVVSEAIAATKAEVVGSFAAHGESILEGDA